MENKEKLKARWRNECTVEGLSYNSFYKRVKRTGNIYLSLHKPVNKQSIPIEFNGVKYSSIFKFFHSEEVNSHETVTYHIFLDRLKKYKIVNRVEIEDIPEDIIRETILTPNRRKGAVCQES